MAILSDFVSPPRHAGIWHPPAPRALMQWPLPEAGRRNRWLLRALSALARRQVLAIDGLHHIAPRHDPLIVAINHSTRSEAIFVPALLMLHRGGRLVHFLADWNFRLIPGLGFLYRRAQTISVMRKPAKPGFLNVLKPLYVTAPGPLEQARRKLAAGRAIGVFPEATVNRDPQALLPGRRGAAYLSLVTRAPVVPVGIRFPDCAPLMPISDHARMTVTVGAPMHPPVCGGRPTAGEIRAWHATIMTEISRLCGKSWRNP